MKKFLYVLFITAALLYTQPQKSYAAVSGIAVTPFMQEVNFDGTEPQKSFSFEVANSTDYTQVLAMSILDFGSLDESGGIAFSGTNPNQLIKKYGLSPWLTLSPEAVSLEPRKSAKITAKISNEETMQPGGHYAAVLIRPQTTNAGGKNPINVKPELSTLVFAKKLGGEKYDLRLSQVSHNGNLLHPPTKVSLRFYNPGNAHVIPRGIVKLQANGNKIPSQTILNEDSGLVLPETYRTFSVDVLKPSRFSLLPLQTYSLQVDYRYDGLSRFASATFTMRSFDIPVLVGWVVLLLFTVLAAYTFYKKKRAARASLAAERPKKRTKITVKAES